MLNYIYFCVIIISLKLQESSKVNKHPHSYLLLLDLGLLMTIYSPTNVKFELKNLDLVLRWDIYQCEVMGMKFG